MQLIRLEIRIYLPLLLPWFLNTQGFQNVLQYFSLNKALAQH